MIKISGMFYDGQEIFVIKKETKTENKNTQPIRKR